jgi:GT2 family glycosyltransferase
MSPPMGADPGFAVRVGGEVPDQPDLTVCVLVLDRTELVERCLDSIGSASSRAVEIIVVANGTGDAALCGLTARSDIVLVRSGINLGFGGGNNLAAEFARGSYLVFVNDDSVLGPGCLDRLLARAESDPSIGAVGSRIVSGDGSLQEAGAVVWADGSATHVGRGLDAGAGAHGVSRDVDYCSANGLLVRRTGWEAVGGFDERYFPAYYEDVDLCMALWEHGLRVVYEPEAELIHLESQSTTDHYKMFLLGRHRSLFASTWSAELADHEPRPVTDKPAAVQRAIRRRADGGRSTVPVGDRRRRTDPGPTDRAGRELAASVAQREVLDAYIRCLSGDLKAASAELDHRNRWRHRALGMAKAGLSLIPAETRKSLRARVRGSTKP